MMKKDEIYQLFQNNTDEKYRIFMSKLLPPDTPLMGIRLPLLRKTAKKIIKTNWQSVLNELTDNTFEEKMLFGMIVAYAPLSLPDKTDLIQTYLYKIDNWGLCDSFCASFKLTADEKKFLLPFIKTCLQSTNEYIVRFGVVMLLNFYIDNKYLSKCFWLFEQVIHTGYYAQMAVAWAVSICYLRYPQETTVFLKNNKLPDWVHNKAIQKIRESTQLTPNEKQQVLQFKRL